MLLTLWMRFFADFDVQKPITVGEHRQMVFIGLCLTFRHQQLHRRVAAAQVVAAVVDQLHQCFTNRTSIEEQFLNHVYKVARFGVHEKRGGFTHCGFRAMVEAKHHQKSEYAMNIMVQAKEPAYLYETPLLHQSSFWSQVKRNQGYETKAFDMKVRSEDITDQASSSYILDDVLVLLVPVNRSQSIGYVPYGPLLSPKDDRMGLFLEELSMNLQACLPKHCILLRYDLPWKTIWDEDQPETDLQNLRLNWGTQYRSLAKSPLNQLPCDTMLVSLDGSEDQILSRMHHKTRYNIHLAQRKGVQVLQVGYEYLDTFYDLYRQTCERNRITLHDRSFFEALFSADDESAGVTMLMAFYEGQPLSAMFLSRSTRRATYLYGASSNELRNTMSTYALQWEAIWLAKSWNCREYDLFGVSPTESENHPMSGLYTFKKGFGGNLLHRMGCWDFLFDKESSQHFFSFEMVDNGYHQR